MAQGLIAQALNPSPKALKLTCHKCPPRRIQALKPQVGISRRRIATCITEIEDAIPDI